MTPPTHGPLAPRLRVNSYGQVLKTPGTPLILVMWALLVGFALFWWHTLGLLQTLAMHVPLMVLPLVVGLMIAGRLGVKLGIPLLFRNAPDKGRRFSPSFWSGFGATLLVSQVLAVIFMSSWLTQMEADLEFERIEAATGDHAADLVQGRRPWDKAQAPRFDWRSRNILEEWYREKRGQESQAREGVASPLVVASGYGFSFVLLTGIPIWLILGACVLGTDPPSTGLGRPRPWAVRIHEACGYALGWFAMLLLTVGVALTHLIIVLIAYRVLPSGPTHIWLIDELLGFTRLQSLAHLGSFLTFVLLMVVVPLSVTLFVGLTPPGLGISLLLSVFALVYAVFDALQPGTRVVAGVVVGALLVCINGRFDRYRFPGMADGYRDPLDLEAKEEEIERGVIPPGPLGPDGATPLLLNDAAVLERWAEHVDPSGKERPRLVLVCVTGAAYRSSFWTTLVLEHIQRRLPGFFDHVRLITGASGGMVGAAYAVAMKRSPADAAEPPESATERLAAESGLDSLTPVVKEMLRSDVPRALLPGPQGYDRGRALEDQWSTLDIPFEALRSGEAEGWRPSLVLSPMVAETGRRLLFSNLDLYGLTDLQIRTRGGVSCEPIDLGPRPARGGLRRLSRSAVEFFRAFPGSYRPPAGEPFKLKTAVRMNATFPFISPAVSLPVQPPRRVVDAGYYDNYGINVAAAWAFQNREWIRTRTSGLAIVQIRAYESEAVRKRLWVGPGDAPHSKAAALFQRLSIGLRALTTPVVAALGAMQWSMSYRNDEQIQALSELFNARYTVDDGDVVREVDRSPVVGEPCWFESFVFENPVPFGMNWFLAQEELDRMRSSLEGERLDAPPRGRHKLGARFEMQQELDLAAQAANASELDNLEHWWTRRAEATTNTTATSARLPQSAG